MQWNFVGHAQYVPLYFMTEFIGILLYCCVPASIQKKFSNIKLYQLEFMELTRRLSQSFLYNIFQPTCYYTDLYRKVKINYVHRD